MKKIFFILAFLMLVFSISSCAQKLQNNSVVIADNQDAHVSSAKQAVAEKNLEFDEIANIDSLDSSIELLDLVE